VKINAEKFIMMADRAGVSDEQLAAALPRASDRRKEHELALKKVRNWMAGRNHPAAKSADVTALAGAMGCSPSDFASFSSTHRFARSAPRKARLLADLIRGRSIDEADALLRFSTKRAAVMVRKVLRSAIDQAEANDAELDRLVVSEVKVDDSVRIKRFQPKDRGRAHPIIKRTSHITVAVEEGG